ncbi:MAG: hypothetical protein IAX21_08230 [Candidatus Bathyarchaeota archaeon]|nr:MAG: hypothetical protein IAX21_08230 [Candidatus Bathyarchaeota archaeon]
MEKIFEGTCEPYAMIIMISLAVAFIFLGFTKVISMELTVISVSILIGFMISITLYCYYKDKNASQFRIKQR